MKKKTNAERTPLTPDEKKRLIFLGVIAAFLLIMLVVLLVVFLPKDDVPTLETTKPSTPETTLTEPSSETTVPTEDTTEPTTQPTEPEESLMLKELARLYEENSDLIGWVRIDGTMIDYPVMHTPYDGEKYIHKNFYGEYSFAGLPFLEDGCSMDPESENLIIYGHHMINGTMFENLMNYQKKSYWEEHPTIYFATLEEERTYEIFAVLKDRVYYQYEDVFKFYQFIEVDDEETFNEGMAYFLENSLYDTGITPQYGDRLLTLVTCAYHHQYGRFVVLARLVEN